MTIIRCALTRDGRAATVKGGKEPEKRTYRRTWNVISDNDTDDEFVIVEYFRSNRNTVGFVGDRYPKDRNCICTSISPKLSKSSPTQSIWNVDQDFEPEDSESKQEKPDSNGNPSTDPEQWLEIDAGAYTDTVPVYLATYREGIDALQPGMLVCPMNAAGVPFDPPLEKEITVDTLRVSRYATAWIGGNIRVWVNGVNDRAFTYSLETYEDTWPPFTARIRSITGSYKLVNGDFWWKKTSEIHIHPDGWRAIVPNIGTAAAAKAGDPDGKGGTISAAGLKNGVPRLRKMLDVNGKSVQNKVFLNAKGQPVAEGDPPTYVTYSIYPEIDFSIPYGLKHI